jgi:hypothetical protein
VVANGDEVKVAACCGFTLDADRKVVTSPVAPQLARNSIPTIANGLHAYPMLKKDSSHFIDRTPSVWFIDHHPPLIRIQAPSDLKVAVAGPGTSDSETHDNDPDMNGRLIDREGNLRSAGEKEFTDFSVSLSRNRRSLRTDPRRSPWEVRFVNLTWGLLVPNETRSRSTNTSPSKADKCMKCLPCRYDGAW